MNLALFTLILIFVALLGILYLAFQLYQLKQQTQSNSDQREQVTKLLLEQQQIQAEQRSQFEQYQFKSLTTLQESLRKSVDEVRKELTASLKQQADYLGNRVDKLTEVVDTRLKEISGQVDKKLAEGFEKTNATFTDVIKRLAIIDQAQKRITELSTNVVSLQEILSDKKSRGAFGEVQLNALIDNMIPKKNYQLQATLGNGKRVDCLLLLPEPTGHVAIDAKFPLESYKAMHQAELPESQRRVLEAKFRQDVKKHIDDIQKKYILPGETSDGAIMFLPAEAIFAEIHSNYPDLIELAQKARVWVVSPTTLMAILTTARAVLKDADTRKQVHIIQEHLVALSKDFSRFQGRMDKLATHIQQASKDVEEVHTSSRKITSRFSKIERVELPEK